MFLSMLYIFQFLPNPGFQLKHCVSSLGSKIFILIFFVFSLQYIVLSFILKTMLHRFHPHSSFSQTASLPESKKKKNQTHNRGCLLSYK